jgi:hypothetical protein
VVDVVALGSKLMWWGIDGQNSPPGPAALSWVTHPLVSAPNLALGAQEARGDPLPLAYIPASSVPLHWEHGWEMRASVEEFAAQSGAILALTGQERWFVVRTQPHREAQAERQLANQDYRIFRPAFARAGAMRANSRSSRPRCFRATFLSSWI